MTSEDVIAPKVVAHECRSCAHRPRHWLRMEGIGKVWHEAFCRKAKTTVHPDGVCGRWMRDPNYLSDCDGYGMADAEWEDGHGGE